MKDTETKQSNIITIEGVVDYCTSILPDPLLSAVEKETVANYLAQKKKSALMQEQVEVPGLGSNGQSTRWAVIVAEKVEDLGGIDALAQQMEGRIIDETSSLTVRQSLILEASMSIAKGRILDEIACGYSNDEIQKQLKYARKGNPDITEEDIRRKRAQKEYKKRTGNGNGRDEALIEKEQLLAVSLADQINSSDGPTLTASEQIILSQHFSTNTFKKLARGGVEQALIDNLKAATLEHQQVLARGYWEITLNGLVDGSAIEWSSVQDKVHLAIAERMLSLGALGEYNQFSEESTNWIIEVLDHHIAKELDINPDTLPLPTSLLRDRRHHAIITPNIPELTEYNRRLLSPGSKNILVCCPDYSRQSIKRGENSWELVYIMDDVGTGEPANSQRALPIIIDQADNLAKLGYRGLEADDIPTFRIAMANIEGDEHNLARNNVPSHQEFLSRLDGSTQTMANKIIADLSERGHRVQVETVESDETGYMAERNIYIYDDDGNPLVKFSLGALTSSFNEIDGYKGLESWKALVASIRKEDIAMLMAGDETLIRQTDSMLLLRLQMMFLLEWDEIEQSEEFNKAARIYSQASEQGFSQPIRPSIGNDGLHGLTAVVNQAIEEGDKERSEINRLVLSWLEENNPDILDTLRSKYLYQESEYKAVEILINMAWDNQASHTVADVIGLWQKVTSSEKSSVPRVYIKGESPYRVASSGALEEVGK